MRLLYAPVLLKCCGLDDSDCFPMQLISQLAKVRDVEKGISESDRSLGMSTQTSPQHHHNITVAS